LKKFTKLVEGLTLLSPLSFTTNPIDLFMTVVYTFIILVEFDFIAQKSTIRDNRHFCLYVIIS
jgi:hypothetical protein